jgi:hypothetical protein
MIAEDATFHDEEAPARAAGGVERSARERAVLMCMEYGKPPAALRRPAH